MQGEIIGTHKGIANYTLGQRRGLGFAGGKPLYVGRIDPETNTVALGTREEASSNIVRASELSILIPEEFKAGERVHGKIRSYGDTRPCRIVEAQESEMKVEFDRPQFAPTPGQRIVLYNSDDFIIAGGTIIQT